MVRTAVVDEEWELVLFLLLSCRLKPTPLRYGENGFAVRLVELAVRIKPLRANDARRVGRGWGGRVRCRLAARLPCPCASLAAGPPPTVPPAATLVVVPPVAGPVPSMPVAGSWKPLVPMARSRA